MYNRRTVAPSTASANTSSNLIDPRRFKFAIVIDAQGSRSLKVGQVYPIIDKLPAGAGMTQAVRGGRSVELNFEYPTVTLAGVRTARGNAAKPYKWDSARFREVSFDSLTASQKAEALSRFGTTVHTA